MNGETLSFRGLARDPARVWALAALAAMALHIGGAALVFDFMRQDDDEPEFGAPAIEIGVELLAQRNEPTDLPPGPETEDSAASAAVPEQSSAVEQSDLPKETPVKTDDPERQAGLAEMKEPEKEEKVQPQMATAASAASSASEATAAPSSKRAKESPRSAAPVQGLGESQQRVRATWQKELIAHLDRHKRYPAERPAQDVQVSVILVLDGEGHVLSASVARGSGRAAFDQAALDMIHRSDPVPRPPPLVAHEGLTFQLPVIFRSRRAGR